MNINLGTNYPLDDEGRPITFQEEILEHQDIMAMAGFTLTGRTTLCSDPDPAYPGAMQVWSETTRGTWVWVNPEGEAVEAAWKATVYA